ncbi:hypothetical protein ACQ859_16325 [Roseateles chitinivorans]|uniref:hypothetical protein n=1 Tax=Roseateles chitinivorans TaxID=2917965 RepID=UPI003D66D3D1
MRQRISTNHQPSPTTPPSPPSLQGGTAYRLRIHAIRRGRSIPARYLEGDDPDELEEPNEFAGDHRHGGAQGGTEWTEEEIVLLHWRLLQDVRHLADPAAPLEEKLSTLRWIFTEPDKDTQPFSFVSCLRVVGCSPLSPIAFCGRVDSESIREHIASNARRWLTESLTRYPDWVAHALADNPAWVEAQLSRNPQCINEQVRVIAAQGDLFA